MTDMQLTIDGREVPHAGVPHRVHQPRLTPVQREILELLDAAGSIRTVMAGVVVHEARGHCGSGAKSSHRTLRRRANKLECCAYAHADGLEAMKRLEARGLVRRTFIRGRWVRP